MGKLLGDLSDFFEKALFQGDRVEAEAEQALVLDVELVLSVLFARIVDILNRPRRFCPRSSWRDHAPGGSRSSDSRFAPARHAGAAFQSQAQYTSPYPECG